MPLQHAADRLARFATTLPERAATFAERGWAVPFTAPLLAGARLRRGAGGEPELILPGLAGRGSYILGWPAALEAAQPTLHDRRLWDLASALPEPGAAPLREAARRAALEGLAGRRALAAARAQAAAHGAAVAAARDALPADAPPAWVEAVALIGAGRDGPVPRLVAALRKMAEELGAWLTDAPGSRAGQVVLAAARLALAGAQACLDRLPPPPRDAAAATLWQRPDLLLDGWRLLVPAWSAAAREERAEALATMAAHLPIPPLEADAWPGAACAWDPVLRLRRSLGPQPLPPQGLPDLVARNERLLAVAA